MADSDPFIQVHDAMWTTLEAYAGFTELVAERRRLKDTEADFVPDTVGPADSPLVRIVARGDAPHIQRTSSDTSIQMAFDIQLSTTSQKYATLFATQFAILRAMMRWESYIKPLTWAGKEFVRDFRFTSSETSGSSRELNRGITGWATVMSCTVQMWFKTADLTPTE